MVKRFSTGDATPRRLSYELEDWRRDAADGERRTVIIRLTATADAAQVAEALRGLGCDVLSTGGGALSATVQKEMLDAPLGVPGVARIDAPAQLRPKSGL